MQVGARKRIGLGRRDLGGQIRRVLRPGGQLLLSDSMSPEDDAKDTYLNAIEVMRDPSHVRNHRPSQWRAMFGRAGFAASEALGSGLGVTLARLAGNAADRYYFVEGQELWPRHLVSVGEIDGADQFGLIDHWLDVRVQWNFQTPVRFWRHPVETVSLSEAGFERIYQSSVVVPNVELSLPPGDTVELSFDLEVSKARETV